MNGDGHALAGRSVTKDAPRKNPAVRVAPSCHNAAHLRLLPAMRNDGWQILSWILAGSVAAYFVYVAADHPSRDWDMVSYVMAILNDGTRDVAALNVDTWAAIKSRTTEAELRHLTTGVPYREELYANAAALVSQLPIYESKYGYVLLTKAVALVLHPVDTLVWISLAGSLTILAVLFGHSLRLGGIASLAWLPIVKLLNLSALSNFPTPDAIATAFVLLGVGALLARRFAWAVVLLVVATFLRPDTFILNGLLGLWLLPQSLRATLALAVGTIAAYQFDMWMGKHPGWWAQFTFNFMEMPTDLRVFAPRFELAAYLDVLKAQALRIHHHDWVYSVLGLFILAASSASGPDRPRILGLLAVLAVAFVVRFLLYPSLEWRVYSSILFALPLLVLYAAAPAVRDRHLFRR